MPGLRPGPRTARRCPLPGMRAGLHRRGVPRSQAQNRVHGTDALPRRGAPRRRAPRGDLPARSGLENPQRHAADVPVSDAGGSNRRSRVRQRPRDGLERRPRRIDGRHRHQPALRARSGRPLGSGSGRSQAPAAPVRRVHQGMVARRPRASVAGRASRDTGRSAPGAGRRWAAVRVHARAQERVDREGRADGEPGGARVRAHRAHRSQTGAAAKVRPSEPSGRSR